MNQFVSLTVMLLITLLTSSFAWGRADTGVPLTPMPVPPPAEDLRFERLTAASESEIVTATVTLEEGEVSILLSVRTQNSTAGIVVTKIVDPGGAPIYELTVNTDDFDNSLFVSEAFSSPIVSSGSAAVLLPPVPQLAITPGAYQVTFRSTDGPILMGQVLYKRQSQLPIQAIDLDLWYATASTAVMDESGRDQFETALTEHMNVLLNPHALQVGAIQSTVAPSDVTAAFGTLNVEDLGSLCQRLANEAPLERAARVIFVDDITALNEMTGEPEVCCAGIASAAPGVLFDGLSPTSCVVASMTAYNMAGDLELPLQAGNVLHEISHFLSIPHTTEEDGVNFDRFLRTPDCRLELFDLDASGTVDDLECGRDGGADNFIFYGGVAQLLPFYVSSDQSAIMRVHPLFYPVDAEMVASSAPSLVSAPLTAHPRHVTPFKCGTGSGFDKLRSMVTRLP